MSEIRIDEEVQVPHTAGSRYQDPSRDITADLGGSTPASVRGEFDPTRSVADVDVSVPPIARGRVATTGRRRTIGADSPDLLPHRTGFGSPQLLVDRVTGTATVRDGNAFFGDTTNGLASRITAQFAAYHGAGAPELSTGQDLGRSASDGGRSADGPANSNGSLQVSAGPSGRGGLPGR